MSNSPKHFIDDVNDRKEAMSNDKIKKDFSENLIPEHGIQCTLNSTPTHVQQTQHATNPYITKVVEQYVSHKNYSGPLSVKQRSKTKTEFKESNR